jgi:Fur family transcriptional regulator, zinc uptake regulator
MPQDHRPSCASPDMAFAVHDHHLCADDALARAEAIAKDRRLRLTPVRRRTLEILLESHRAVSAYEMLSLLAKAGFGNQPPVAYRALEFLEQQGFVHRVRRLNAYVACMHMGEAHTAAFLICARCHAIAEAGSLPALAALESAALASGFAIEATTIEATGLCPACQGLDHAQDHAHEGAHDHAPALVP